MRQMMFSDHYLHIHAEVVRTPQDLHHAAYRILVLLFGELQQLHVDDHPVEILDVLYHHRFYADAIDGSVRRWPLHALGDLDPLPDALVMRNYEVAAPADAEFPH